MKNAIIQAIENKQKRTDLPSFRAGDNVKVHLRIVEGKKERIQIYEGVVIRFKEDGIHSTFTVRKIVDGVGVEKTFPLNSRVISKIEVVNFGKVRRARLFYLRDLLGSKETRVKEDLNKNIEAAVEKAKVRKEEAKRREETKKAEKVAAAEAAAKAEAAKKAEAAAKVEAPKAETTEAPKADTTPA